MTTHHGTDSPIPFVSDMKRSALKTHITHRHRIDHIKLGGATRGFTTSQVVALVIMQCIGVLLYIRTSSPWAVTVSWQYKHLQAVNHRKNP